MAIELITCAACGAKNASDRTICLQCGAGLVTKGAEPIGDRSQLLESERRLNRGEIILLWIAGLWAAFILLVGAKENRDLIEILGPILSVWIICGLVWVTFYGWRKTRDVRMGSLPVADLKPQEEVKMDSTTLTPEWAKAIERRLSALENRLPKTATLDKNFRVRAFAVWGHTLV